MSSSTASEYRKGETSAARHSFLKSMRRTAPPHLTTCIELCMDLDTLIEHSVHLLQQTQLQESSLEDQRKQDKALTLC